MHNRRFIFANPTVRSATAWIVLVGICASALPIPMGRIVRQTKDLSQPFPCQHCACGCKNAEQCWTSCCCYTAAQRVEWAKQHGVTPPRYAVLADEPSLADDRKSGGEACGKTCCSRKPTDARVASKQSIQKSACTNCSIASSSCEKKDCSSTNESTAADPNVDFEDAESEAVMVLSIMAYKCSGQATVFSLLPWAIIEAHPSTARSWELIGRYASDESVRPIRVFLFPDVPPPRRVG